MPHVTNQHALYATTNRRDGTPGPTFRVGRPVNLDRAMGRWQRVDDRRFIDRRPQHIRFDGKRLPVRFFEVRTVDSDGRGLGSERHSLAMPVPFRNLRLDNPKR